MCVFVDKLFKTFIRFSMYLSIRFMEMNNQTKKGKKYVAVTMLNEGISLIINNHPTQHKSHL